MLLDAGVGHSNPLGIQTSDLLVLRPKRQQTHNGVCPSDPECDPVLVTLSACIVVTFPFGCLLPSLTQAGLTSEKERARPNTPVSALPPFICSGTQGLSQLDKLHNCYAVLCTWLEDR